MRSPSNSDPLDSSALQEMVLHESIGLEDRVLLSIYLNEAIFFWRFLKPLLSRHAPIRVLEVGSGIGLLSLFACTASKTVTSLEPESSGFGKMSAFRQVVLEFWSGGSLPEFRDCRIEELPQNETFDFIYSLMVLEHVPEPETLISEVYDRLNPGGTAWFVLPNYSFPYEQHFEIPILINKAITWNVFRKKIRKHAFIPDPEEMWSELSWPTQRALRKFLESNGWAYTFRNNVIQGYFERLNEPDFVSRKGPAYKFLRTLIAVLKPAIVGLPFPVQPVIEFTISKPRTETESPNGQS